MDKKEPEVRIMEIERRKMGISQSELARRAGVSAGYISRMECRGWAYPGHLKRVADALMWKEDPDRLMDMVEVRY